MVVDENRKIVKSYNNVWHLSRTFYSLGGIDLPMPVSMNFMMYFILAEVPMYFIGGLLPGMIRYLIIPGVIAWIFDQRMIDGKNPYQFFRSIAVHYFIVFFKGYKVSRFKHYKVEYPSVKMVIPYRKHEALK